MEETRDPWAHRSSGMLCRSCMYFVEKAVSVPTGVERAPYLGRCRRHAPATSGYPVVFPNDWCGDHKLSEEKV